MHVGPGKPELLPAGSGVFPTHVGYAGDRPSMIYLERCLRYRETPPPATWDGVWTMEQK